jgi:hypothetical protein
MVGPLEMMMVVTDVEKMTTNHTELRDSFCRDDDDFGLFRWSGKQGMSTSVPNTSTTEYNDEECDGRTDNYKKKSRPKGKQSQEW